MQQDYLVDVIMTWIQKELESEWSNLCRPSAQIGLGFDNMQIFVDADACWIGIQWFDCYGIWFEIKDIVYGWNWIKGEVMDKKIKTGSEDEKVKVPNEINDEQRQSNSMVAIK